MNIYRHWQELSDVAETIEIAANTRELRASSGRYILKTKSNERELQTAIRVVNALSGVGMPVERPVRTVSGGLYVAENEKLYCLFRRLRGDTVDDGFDRVNCFMFGEAIARLHDCLDRLNIADLQLHEMKIHDNIDALIDIKSRASKKPYAAYLRSKARELEELPKAPIHRDPHPQNIIFEYGELSGFIDLELSTNGPRIFDAVYCSTAILSNMYQKQKEKWPEKLFELLNGYRTIRQFDELERRCILPMAIYIQQLFAWFYEKHHNDEMAALNSEIGQWLFLQKERITKMVGLE